jgi:hypothetical protein
MLEGVIFLIVVLSISIFAAIELLSRIGSDSDVFVGVEFVYNDKLSDFEELVDKVKGATSLFVIGRC